MLHISTQKSGNFNCKIYYNHNYNCIDKILIVILLNSRGNKEKKAKTFEFFLARPIEIGFLAFGPGRHLYNLLPIFFSIQMGTYLHFCDEEKRN